MSSESKIIEHINQGICKFYYSNLVKIKGITQILGKWTINH